MSINKKGLRDFEKEAEKRGYELNSKGDRFLNKKTGGEAYVSESGQSVVVNTKTITSLPHVKTTKAW